MPKLGQLQDNLKGTKRRERQQVEKSVQATVTGSESTLAAKINQGLQALNNAANQSRQKLASLLMGEINKIPPEIAKSQNALMKRVDALEKRLSQSEQLGRDNVKALLGGTEAAILEKLGFSGEQLDKLATRIDAVGSDIGKISFPTTDLTTVHQQLDGVVETLSNIPTKQVVIPKQKQKWTFTVHRDNEDMITKVTVN